MEHGIIKFQKIEYPEANKSNYVFVYSLFNDELRELLEKSGYVAKFSTEYAKAIRFLEHLKTNCIHASKIFEKLKSANGLYSMKLKGEKNIRILFVFKSTDTRDIAILLTCFQEKDKEDYRAAIKLANDRVEEIDKGTARRK
jgi:aspartokinase